jgi:HEAT repeats
MSPQLMNTMTPRSGPRVALLVMLCCAVLAFVASVAAGQSRIISPQAQPITPQPQPSPIVPAKPPLVATLRSTDSAQGSRVALTSDQSLSDYEAYRRGDRFYVRIPATDVRRADNVHGRAFADVRAQRTGDTTLVSFRLQPGATAHIEERSNRLDVVITLPGASASATPSTAGTSTAANPGNNNSDRDNTATARQSTAARSTTTPTPRDQKALISPTATPAPGSVPRQSAITSATPMAPQKAISSPVAASQASNPTQPQPSASGWAGFKARLHYWVLLAQLNPIPVSIGVAIVLLLIGMFFYQRRVKVNQRAGQKQSPPGSTNTDSKLPAEEIAATAAVNVEDPRSEPSTITPAKTADAQPSGEEPGPENARNLRINAVANEVGKILLGETYDREIIGSVEPETRQLVSAELLSAMVGRNAERRDRARAAFIEHGYFDDATRDLRISESSNERAAAARRLSFVRNRDAGPHLIAALDDSAADVRRAAVEALTDLRDPSSIAALNSLMQTETDRRVPRSLIKRAIEACATSAPDDFATDESGGVAGPIVVQSSNRPDREREVFEL